MLKPLGCPTLYDDGHAQALETPEAKAVQRAQKNADLPDEMAKKFGLTTESFLNKERARRRVLGAYAAYKTARTGDLSGAQQILETTLKLPEPKDPEEAYKEKKFLVSATDVAAKKYIVQAGEYIRSAQALIDGGKKEAGLFDSTDWRKDVAIKFFQNIFFVTAEKINMKYKKKNLISGGGYFVDKPLPNGWLPVSYTGPVSPSICYELALLRSAFIAKDRGAEYFTVETVAQMQQQSTLTNYGAAIAPSRVTGYQARLQIGSFSPTYEGGDQLQAQAVIEALEPFYMAYDKTRRKKKK